MGKHKRKREKSAEELMRKIRKLEKDVQRSRERRRSSSYSKSNEETGPETSNQFAEDGSYLALDMDMEYDPADYLLTQEDNDDQIKSVVTRIDLPEVTEPGKDLPEVISPSGAGPGAPSAETSTAVPVPEASLAENESENVPEEILSMLGEAKKSSETFGKKIPHEISERWGKILLEGLAKDAKEALLKKTLIPENFQFAKAPKLNAEVASVLTDPAKNRDKRLEKSQNQLGTAIAGVVNLTTELINSNLDKMQIIQKLSEINQTLLDLHYEETLNRRRLIIPMLDKNFWNIIQGVKRDTYLFGENLSENIKTSKNLERSSQQIKKPAPTQSATLRRNSNQPGNSRAPPRQTTGAGRAAPPPPAPRPPPPRYYSYREPTAAPPPAATRRQPATAQRGRTGLPYRHTYDYDRRGRR